MSVDFFESELKKARNRFNSIFGNLVVCNLKVRQMLILAITWMGVLKRKIDNAKDKEAVREEIKKFVKYRDLVNNVFNKIEIELQERRAYGHSDDKTKEHRKADIGR
jgi:hypothetical protein